MKFETPHKDTGCFPLVLARLKALDEEHVYGHEHQLSHPADIFLITFMDAIYCINILAKSVNKLTKTVELGGSVNDDSLAAIRHQVFDLLFDTGNFVEGCQSIIKSLFPRGDKQLTKAARDFKGNIENYTSHASQLINKVKHQHRRPRIFTFKDVNKIIVGYYLEGLVSKGVLGPDPELHKSYHGMQTGFSLNRAIPYHLCNLYYVSACLDSVIKTHGFAGSPSTVIIEDEFIRETLSEVERIPCMLLPDEMEKPLPVISCKSNGNFKIEFPGKKDVINKSTHTAEVSLETRIGIYDRGIAPPYMLISK